MQRLLFHIATAALYCISKLPFWILYRISDFLYIILLLVKYRNDVITQNLSNSFPNYSSTKIKQIRNKFYQHFCDIIIETIKLRGTSVATIQKRVEIENIEYLNEAYDKGRDVVAVFAHYNNWEWSQVINTKIKANGCAVYHPLSNPLIDDYMLRLRAKFKALIIPLFSANRQIVKLKRDNKRYVLGLISDQSPGFISIQYCMEFLNQRTPVILGTEKLSKLTNDIVVFVEMHKIKRGYYKLRVVPLCDNPKKTEPYEITHKHVKHLEKLIINKPEHWLWSHRRWKFADKVLEDEQTTKNETTN